MNLYSFLIICNLLLVTFSSSIFEEGIITVKSLKLPSYIGRWYQMFSDLTAVQLYESHALCVIVDYEQVSNNTLKMSGSFRKFSPFGKIHEVPGSVIQPEIEHEGNMQIQLVRMPYTTPYLVIKLGPLNPNTNLYEYSIVTDSNKGTLFVLARSIWRFRRYYQEEVLEFCKENGFVAYYNEPRETPQPPACEYPRSKIAERHANEYHDRRIREC